MDRAGAGCNIDQLISEICDQFVGSLANLSRDTIVQEGVLKAAIFRVAGALERKFEGYEDVISTSLYEVGELIGSRVPAARTGAA